MKNSALLAGIIGTAVNFLLFLTKLYIGIASGSLAIYCDGVNNLGDTFACAAAVLGFALSIKLSEKKSLKTQSLCTFVISLLIAATGVYFVYSGTERLFYPTPVSYTLSFALIITATIGVKILLALMFRFFDKKQPSPVLKALVLDSILDCFITLFALMGLVLVRKLNYAVDGLFAVISGSIITVSAIKNIISESKYLINN